MVFALLALQLLGNADSVQIGAGQAIDQAVNASLTSNRLIHFDEPQFKVFVGIYGSRLEAEYALRKWRANFPTSFAVQAPNERFKKTPSSN